MNKQELFDFYKGKKVLVTGHTGFKGSWLTKMLLMAGADVTGYSLEPPTNPSLFELADLKANMNSIVGDIRDFNYLNKIMDEVQPEIVIHLAAQPIVRTSYKEPRYTYETNVMGTVNLCESIRLHECVKSFLNVTTDKVYLNNEWCWGYRENEPLDGFDPYSNSKSCSELVTHSYIKSFFGNNEPNCRVAASTARAGNVIGGGDFAEDRIIPDSIRTIASAKDLAKEKATILVRNPFSTRPYQHVLEPLYVYITIAALQYNDAKYADCYNVGPDDCDCVKTGELLDMFCASWNMQCGDLPTAEWISKVENDAPHEANFLKLDCSKVKSTFNWAPRWHINECIDMTVRFTKVLLENPKAISNEMSDQIIKFLK